MTQRVGWTDVTVTYSRPRVRGRVIWGELVPWGEVWRTGADYPTVFETTESLEVEGQQLPAGRYALYTIPRPEGWTIIFSGNTELWGAFGYQADQDQLRIEVTPESDAAWTESFTIEFADARRDGATLLLRWARLAVPVGLRVDITMRVRQEVESADVDDWGPSWRGASYLLEIDHDLPLAREWIQRSVTLDRNWMNVWTLAEVLARVGELDAALAAAAEALQICRAESAYCPYAEVYARQAEQWRAQR